MKNLLLPLAATMISLCASAEVLSPEEALTRACENSPSKVASKSQSNELMHVYTGVGSDNEAAVYVFATPDKGYVVLSADDCALPMLGYCDSGSFDTALMPPSMRAWLDNYAQQISALRSAGTRACAPSRATVEDFEPIEPMIKTKWNQSAPFNAQCPIDPTTNEKCVTGCVATAMAQMLYYYKSPVNPTGSYSYTSQSKGIEQSMDFSTLTFDWEGMLTEYPFGWVLNSDFTKYEWKPQFDESKIPAIAELLHACGVSVGMDYASTGSGASSFNIATSLINFFGYDSGIYIPSREYYSASEWIELTYNHLHDVGPIIVSAKTPTGYGHAFLCDGYSSDSFFHINWGWGGYCDGYFLLGVLDEYNAGSTDTQTINGYTQVQDLICGIRPSTSTSTPIIEICCNKFEFATDQMALDNYISVAMSLYNHSYNSVNAVPAIRIQSEDGSTDYYVHSRNSASQELPYMRGLIYSGSAMPISAALEDGEYTLSPALYDASDQVYYSANIDKSKANAYNMTVSNGMCYLSAKPLENEAMEPVMLACKPGVINSLWRPYSGALLNEDGTTVAVYEFDGIEDNYIYGSPVLSLDGGKPYMFIPTGNYVTFSRSDAAENMTLPSATGYNGLIGVKDAQGYQAKGNGYIIFTAGGLKFAHADGNKVGYGKCYIECSKMPTSSTPASIGAQKIGAFSDGTSSIEGVSIDFSMPEAPIYNAQGQRVGTDYRGLVIKNGKKQIQ